MCSFKACLIVRNYNLSVDDLLFYILYCRDHIFRKQILSRCDVYAAHRQVIGYHAALQGAVDQRFYRIIYRIVYSLHSRGDDGLRRDAGLIAVNADRVYASLLARLDHTKARCSRCMEHDIRAAVPKWIPEGFELVELNVDDEYEIVDISARYKKGEDVIIFSIIQVQEGGMIDAFYEMNEESLRTETVGTLEVYFFSNNARNSAAWNEDEYLVYFSGDITEQEVEKMV